MVFYRAFSVSVSVPYVNEKQFLCDYPKLVTKYFASWLSRNLMVGFNEIFLHINLFYNLTGWLELSKLLSKNPLQQ